MPESAQIDELPPLERRKFESQAAFDALQRWLDLPAEARGDYKKHAARVGRSHVQVKQWAHRFDWPARTAQHDQEQRRIKMASLLKAANEMVERHARSSGATNHAITIVTTTLLQRLSAVDGQALAELRAWPLRDHFALFRALAAIQPMTQKAERIARGEPENETWPTRDAGNGEELFARIERYAAVYEKLAKDNAPSDAPPAMPSTPLLIVDNTKPGNGQGGT